MIHHYTTSGTCSRQIDIEVNDATGLIENVKFHGGCPGNLQGISRLVIGRKPADVAGLLRGIPCRDKATSCPDQLARALAEISLD